MDWSNEHYVRLYTRDTLTWKKLGWQAHCVIGPIMRKLDASGIMEGVSSAEDIAAMLGDGTPLEIVEAGLRRLLDLEVFTVTENGLLMVNFIEAQWAIKSDKQRQRESRERRRSESRAVTDSHAQSRAVTPCHSQSRNVTEESRSVTDGHAESRAVTPCHTLSLPQCIPDSILDITNKQKYKSDAPARDPICDSPVSGPRKEASRKPRREPADESAGDQENPSVRKLVTDSYFDEFRRVRGAKPCFGSREGKSIRELLASVDGNQDRAIAIIQTAFADQWWRDKITINDIARDPSKFIPKSSAINAGVNVEDLDLPGMPSRKRPPVMASDLGLPGL